MAEGSIVYLYGSSLYINLTNRCSNHCSFCIRNFTDNLGDADNLWLETEPEAEMVIERIREEICTNEAAVEEIIFCGYGEPTERLDTLIAVSKGVREFSDKPIRLNTNGQSDLINKKQTAPMLEGILDAVSVSLNAPTAEKYLELCQPEFGIASFEAILEWTKEVKKYVSDVRMSVVSVISKEDTQASRRIAEDIGADFLVR